KLIVIELVMMPMYLAFIFFFQAEDGIRYFHVTGVQTCALPILRRARSRPGGTRTPVSWPSCRLGPRSGSAGPGTPEPRPAGPCGRAAAAARAAGSWCPTPGGPTG